MKCPRCGWNMRQINSRIYKKHCDTLYQCRCGNTHLDIQRIALEENTIKNQLIFEPSKNEKALTV